VTLNMCKQPNGNLPWDQAIDLAWIYMILRAFGILNQEIFFRMFVVNIKSMFAKYDILHKLSTPIKWIFSVTCGSIRKRYFTFEPIFNLCFGLIPYSLGMTPSASSCNNNIQNTKRNYNDYPIIAQCYVYLQEKIDLICVLHCL